MLELATLGASSSKGSSRRSRSSSERKDVGRSCSSLSRELRRGHDGKAQLESRALRPLREEISMGIVERVELIELYELYDPHMLAVVM